MPRKPSHPSVVRDLRCQALKLTQAQLAERLGVQTVTIKGIENGAFRISPRLALALATLLNLDYKDIMANNRAILKDALKAQPLSKWDEKVRTLSDSKIASLQFEIGEGAGDLLHTAHDHAPTKLVSLISALYAALHDLAKEFGLKDALKKVQKRSRHTIAYECPICGCLFVCGRIVAFECPNGHRLEPKGRGLELIIGSRNAGQSARKPAHQPPSPGSGNGD
jgi:DNA-binding XRE family transcriptional regulator